MPSLYELNASYRNLMERLYDDELPEDALIDTLDSIEGAIEDKAEGYSKIIKQFDADIDSINLEVERLTQRKKALENRRKLLKENLFNAMKTVGLSKIKTPLFTVSIQKNGGKRALILDIPVEELPEPFKKVTIAADNEALREWMGNEESCPFCHLAEQGESLRIR